MRGGNKGEDKGVGKGGAREGGETGGQGGSGGTSTASRGERVPVPGPLWVLPTSGLQEAGKRPGSTFAIEVEGLKRRPPSVGERPRP